VCVSLAVAGVIFNLLVGVFGGRFLVTAIFDPPESIMCFFWLLAGLPSCACGIVTGVLAWAYVYRRKPETLRRAIRAAKATSATLALLALIGAAAPSEIDRAQGGIWGEIHPTLKWVAWVLLPLWLALIQFGLVGVWKRLPQTPRTHVSLLSRIALRLFGPLRWWKVFIAAAALAAASPFICRQYRLWGLPDIDEPFDFAAFGHVDVDPADNAYELYRAASDKLTPMSKELREALSASGREAWTSVSDELRNCLEENREALQLYRQGSERPKAVYFQPAELELGTPIPVTANLRTLAKLALLEALRLEDAGDVSGAWKWYCVILRSSRHAGLHGCEVEYGIAWAMPSVAVEPILHWTTLAGVGTSDLRAALDDLRSIHKLAIPASGPLKVEYLMFLKSIEQQARRPVTFDSDPDSSTNRWGMRILYPLGEPEMSYRAGKLMWTNWLSHCDRPGSIHAFTTYRGINLFHSGQIGGLDAIYDIRSWFDKTMFAKLAEPNVGRLIQGRARDEARRTLLETTLALQIYHSETGSYPDFLDGLVGHGVEALPLDPYANGKPISIRYHRLVDPAEEVRVWCVGLDGHDNNGFVDPSIDAARQRDFVMHVTPAKRTNEIAVAASKTPADSIGIKLVRIEPGEFTMGSTEAQLDEAQRSDPNFKKTSPLAGKPAHLVRITKPFYLGETEITRGQFRRFVRDTGYQTEAESDGTGGEGYSGGARGWEKIKQFNWQNPGFSQSDEHPVVMVSWNDAVKFCEWLSEREQMSYRLPTEAEWEYACRAGTSGNFQSSDDPATLAVYGNVADAALTSHFVIFGGINADDGYVFTAPVRHYRANSFGLFDMHGNVEEWCADWHDPNYYAQSPIEDPPGPSSGDVRVVRGGSWGTPVRSCWSAYRGRNSPSDRGDRLGFRVAASPSEIE